MGVWEGPLFGSLYLKTYLIIYRFNSLGLFNFIFMAQVASYLLPFSLHSDELALGGLQPLGLVQMVPLLLLLLTLCLCLLRQNRAPLDPPPLLIVVLG